ncbi:MAG: NAD(+) diphosphatase [Chloroflexi bacterium]|nr:NAD(+) diphosphatase [Chloroflexota bacterium]
MTNDYHVFAGNPLDRGERERRDEGWIVDRTKDKQSRFLPMRDLNVLVSDDSDVSLAWIGTDEIDGFDLDTRYIFLGLMDGVAHFALDVSGLNGGLGQLDSMEGRRYEDVRTAAGHLSGPEAGMAAQARAQLDWNRRHAFCSVCGHKTEIGRGGQVRNCPECKAHHFPRTDPVVIMLVHDGDRCLLGQSRGRLSRMRTYSALAGFMDQAEAIEEAVRREVMEEAGIRVKNVRYHSSQPWPFPSSLMIGCHAEAASTEISMDDEEMTDVRWFQRDEVLAALEGKSETLVIPGSIAIAHHLIRAWANGEVR